MVKKCCLCKKEYVGFGNNAQPLRKGFCCDACNSKVIKIRLLALNLPKQENV